jgi:hypothetical protein
MKAQLSFLQFFEPIALSDASDGANHRNKMSNHERS